MRCSVTVASGYYCSVNFGVIDFVGWCCAGDDEYDVDCCDVDFRG